MKTKLSLLFVLLLAGCGTLDPTGVYKGNKTLYDADITITTSYDTIHAFVMWEYLQRTAASGTMPAGVTQFADTVRAQAPKWFASALSVRDAYASSVTTANATALQTALSVIQAALAQAALYMPATTTTTPTTPVTPTLVQAKLTAVRAAVVGSLPTSK